jgi:UDP-N-acetylmuramate dehydrogenase
VPELLRDHTTLRLGGPARSWVRATTEEELVDAVRTCDEAGDPVLVLAGGSNVVVADEGFDGTVVEVATTGVRADHDGDDPTCGGVVVTIASGEVWDAVVARAVESHWVGVEALSGIPGSVGATPIQNVGAYGQEVSQTLNSVRVWDRKLKGVRTFAAADCGFGYRTSRFKADPGRHVVLGATFQFRQGELGTPVGYAELARTLGVDAGTRAPMADVRRAVLELRRGKGMVLDPDDHDTWSAGSFFTNPLVPADDLPDGAPARPAADGLVKTSAAWLIEHTLALTNRGTATTADLLGLAREIRDGVDERFGIRLVNEPVLVGCEL